MMPNHKELGQDSLKQLELMIEAAMHTLQLLQHQLATAKAIAAGVMPPSNLLANLPNNEAPAFAGQRDHSVWLLDGVPFSKGKLPLAVFKKYVAGAYTLEQLDLDFSSDKVFPKYVRGNRHLFKLAAKVGENEQDRFHTDIITTADGQQVRVTNQVGMNNFKEMILYLASYFKFPVKGKQLNPAKWANAESPFVIPNVEFV